MSLGHPYDSNIGKNAYAGLCPPVFFSNFTTHLLCHFRATMQHHAHTCCFMSCRAVSSLRRAIFVPGLWRRVMLIFDMFVYKFIQNMIIYIHIIIICMYINIIFQIHIYNYYICIYIYIYMIMIIYAKRKMQTKMTMNYRIRI